MSKKNGNHLHEAAVQRAQLLDNQKKHINSLNRLIWILIHKAGGEVRVPQNEMHTPEGWNFSISPDPLNPDQIIFKATDKPQEAQQAAIENARN